MSARCHVRAERRPVMARCGEMPVVVMTRCGRHACSRDGRGEAE